VTEFVLPELGENIEAGDVVRVLVHTGDTLQRDQPILELETDKATIEVPSSVSGVVKELRVKTGDKVKVGQAILVVDDEEAEAPPPDPNASGAKAASTRADAPAAVDAATEGGQAMDAQPKSGTTDDAATRGRQEREQGLGAAGDDQAAAKAGEGPAKAGEGKAGEGPAKAGPHVQAPAGEEGEARAQPGDAPAKAGAQARGRVLDISAGRAQQPQAAEPVPAAPSTRRYARELGLDISAVPGSGPGGRISVEDVKAHARDVIAGAGTALPGRSVALPDFTKWGDVERQPMRAIRRKTAEHMALAWATVPHVTQGDKADITDLEELRRRYAKRVEAAGGKLTITAITLKVIASALKVFPQLNASLDAATDEVVLKRYVHIGVAVDTENGLLVPVIRDVDQKNIVQLSGDLQALADKAKARKLSLEEMEGGSFTISNLGGIGGTYFTPIVNVPEVAILGMSRSVTEPVWKDGQFVPRLMMPLSLSYDHRVIDGADAIRFLRWVCEALEQPFVMSLQG
jgi:pyruvate dehydrogenase E2 component (dihydrolipoyllysine-residue acetyltransferase)